MTADALPRIRAFPIGLMAKDEGPAFAEPLPLRWAKARENDQQAETAVVELYERMRPALAAYAFRYVGRPADAEDLVQAAFVKLLDQLEESAVQNPRAWLYRVVHNLAIDLVRRDGRQEWSVQTWLDRTAATRMAPSIEDEVQRRQQVEQSLLLLNERERHCLLLRAQGLRYEEIGEVLEISAKAVSVYLGRGLKKLGAQHGDR